MVASLTLVLTAILEQQDFVRQHDVESARALAVAKKGGDFSDYAMIQGNIFDTFEPWKLALTTVLLVSFGSLGAAAGIGRCFLCQRKCVAAGLSLLREESPTGKSPLNRIVLAS